MNRYFRGRTDSTFVLFYFEQMQMQQQGGQMGAAVDARLRRYTAPQYAQAAQNGQARDQLLSRSGQGGNTGSSKQFSPQVGLSIPHHGVFTQGVLLGFRSSTVLMV